MAEGFRYARRVQFAETDLAGVVHFSCYFKYMEEAEHALWRAAGLSIERPGAEVGWPRVSASFDYKSPLRFEDEFDVLVRVQAATRSTIQYAFTVACGGTSIGAGAVTTACVRRSEGRMRATELPEGIVSRLRVAAGQDP